MDFRSVQGLRGCKDGSLMRSSCSRRVVSSHKVEFVEPMLCESDAQQLFSSDLNCNRSIRVTVNSYC
jgi:hypothetical protein